MEKIMKYYNILRKGIKSSFFIVAVGVSTLSIGVNSNADLILTDNPTPKSVQTSWLNGLLLGKDMSSVSFAYQQQLKKEKKKQQNLHFQSNDRFKEYNNSIVLLGEQIDALSPNKTKEDTISSLKLSYESAYRNQQKLINSLVQNKRQLEKIKSPKSKIDNIIRLIDATKKSNHLVSWQAFSFNSNKQSHDLSSLIKLSDSLKTSLRSLPIDQKPRIFRNSQLPYSGQNNSAPNLLYTPEISASYASENPMAVQVEDLGESPVVSYSDGVKQLAYDLEHDYIKIYNYVRQNIKLQYYAGAQKGSSATLASLAGNDVDQAALLIALLRHSNVPARFVHGVIRQPIEQAAASLGLSEPAQVFNLLNKAGIAYQPVIEGGRVTAIHREYTWVSAYMPYASYRGSAADLSNRSWIALAPAIKNNSWLISDYDYNQASINADQVVLDFLSHPISQSPIDYWRHQVESDIADNHGDINYQNLLNRSQQNTSNLSLIPSSLPFEVIVVTSESGVLAEDKIQKMQIQMGEAGEYLDISLKLPEIIGKRLSLSYLPATVDDLNIINLSGGMGNVAPYLIDLRPVIKVDGIQKLSSQSGPIAMASSKELKITFSSIHSDRVFYRQALVGNYIALVVTTANDDYGLDSEDPNLFADETRPIRLMHNLAKNYHKQWSQAEVEFAAVMDLAPVYSLPSFSIVSPEYNLQSQFGLVTKLEFKGISLDAMSRSVDVISRKSNQQDSYDFYRLASLHGSYLESNIFNSQWAISAISADQGINKLVTTGSPLIQLTPSDYQAQLNLTIHPQAIKDEISYWLDQGYHAMLASSEDSIDSWNGSSWHLWDPQTGSSGYFISGTYAGGQTTSIPNDWTFSSLNENFQDPYGEGSNNNPLAANSITIIDSTNYQVGEVNTQLNKSLSVIVKDAGNLPVKEALVTFKIKIGESKLIDTVDADHNSEQELTVITNSQGIAKIDVLLPELIKFKTQAYLKSTDSHKTTIGNTLIEVSVATFLGDLPAEELFNIYAIPAQASKIELICWYSGLECESLSSPGGSRSSVMHYRVVDEYGNVVSNVPVRIESSLITSKSIENYFTSQQTEFKMESHKSKVENQAETKTIATRNATSSDAGPFTVFNRAQIAMKKDCPEQNLTAPTCAKEVQILESNYFHTTFQVYSPITDSFSIQISSPDLETVSTDIHPFRWRIGGNDVSQVIHGQHHYFGPYGLYPAVEPSGSLSLYRALYEGETIDEGTQYFLDKLDGEYTITTSSDTGSLEIDINSTGFDIFNFTLPDFPTRAEYTFHIEDYPSLYEQIFNTYMYAATVEIVDINPAVMILNSDSRLAQPIQIFTQIYPASYHPESISINTYRNGVIIDTQNGIYPEFSGKIFVFNPFEVINPYSTYEVEVILNEGTDFEIKSEKTTIDQFSQQIVSHADCENENAFSGASCGGRIIDNRIPNEIRITTSIDASDPLVCRQEGIDLTLNSEADILIELERLDKEGEPTGEITELTNEIYPKGENNIPARAEELGTANFIVTITATSEATDETEIIKGLLISTYEIDGSLLIGHPIVKGVDLADGSMVYSKKDISLSSPGSDLEFVRTYSTGGKSNLGPLGYGWSHNYMSRVIVGNCGRITVTGADGGTARFRTYLDDIIPMKGFHSTLVANQDTSFSFYSKNGTHYHYVKHQNKVWWNDYIEDTNGNRLTIELERRYGAPILRSVTDSVGRKLIYSYETKAVGNYIGEILTSVSGPEGIRLDFTYNEYGQMITANREGDSTNESYSYPLDINGADFSLLTQVTDNATSSIRNYNYIDATTDIPPGLDIFIAVENKKVESISETDGGITSFVYTAGIGSNFHSSSLVSQNNTLTTYNMNTYGAAVEIIAPNGTKTSTWNTTTDVLLESETDEMGREKVFDYDTNGNITQETINGALSRSYTYLAKLDVPPFYNDRIETYTNWRGKTTHYTYDAKGNKEQETLAGITTKYIYNTKGLPTSVIDGRGNTSKIEYDQFGQQSKQIDPLGNKREASWNSRGQKLTETDGNGHQTTYSYDLSDRVLFKQLGTRVWEYSYQLGGRIKTEIDPNSHSTEYSYDSMGRLLNIKNAKGHNFTYSYDANGNKLTENDFIGNQTSFVYDDANRLETKTEPLAKVTTYTYDAVGNVLTESLADRKSSYGYEPNRYFLTSYTGEAPESSTNKSSSKAGLPQSALTIRTVDGEGNVLTQTDPNGNLTTFTYDDFNRVLTEVGVLGSGRTLTYDNNGNVEQEITNNSEGNQTRSFVYDMANRRKFATDATGAVTSFSYDKNNNLEIETRPQNKVTTYSYNNLNKVTSKIEASSAANGAVWIYAYDQVGNLTTETWPNGNVITTVYDELNRPETKSDKIGAISSFTYDPNSNVKTQIDGNGNITTYAYNGLNQREIETKLLGRGHSFSYSVFDELITDTGPNGTITYEYNHLGQRTGASGPDGYNELYSYDVNDNLLSFTDSRGNETTYVVNQLDQTNSQTTATFSMSMDYDTLGNKLSQTDYRGIQSTFEYDLENRQTTNTRAGIQQSEVTYNDAGLAIVEKDANGNNVVHKYTPQYYKEKTNLPESQVINFTTNSFGDITLQNNPGPNDITNVYDYRRRLESSTNGAGETTTYEYDLNNNRTAIIKPNGARWEYAFDEANRLTTVTNTQESISTIYEYDNRDNLIKITDAMGKETEFEFDNRNRKTKKIYPDAEFVDYSYDANGNLETIDLPNGTGIVYVYDILNRRTSETYTGPYGNASVTYTLDANGNVELISETFDGVSFTTTQAFDNLDRINSRTDVYGNNFYYTFDNNGNRKTFKDHQNKLTNYEYDNLNRLDKLTHAGLGTFEWEFNNAGLTKSIDYPNGASVNYTYDSANRIDVIENKRSGGIITSHDYDYDLNGNRKKLTESNIHIDQEILYTYDLADRLTVVEYPNSEITTYVLDKVGNRTQEIITGVNPNTKTYGYNNRDQLVSITDTNGSNSNYTYDLAGNQLTKTKDSIATVFDYTARQRVKTITIGGAPPIAYQYDYTGQRINHQASGLEKRFVYDGLTLIAETNTIGNTLARYHYGDRYQLAETRNTTNSYYHVDSMGTNVAITNQDGSLQARYEYDAYGNLLTESGSSESPFGFTGYQKDDDAGLYYANARYYDSETARFLREDPSAGEQNQPMSLHRYLYAYVNPNKYYDPDGRTAAQFEELMTTAVENFLTNGNRTALGDTGELILEKVLKANGEVIIKGPVTQKGQHNADIISFDPEKNQLSFFDNKIQSLKPGVSRVPNLSEPTGKAKSIEEAIRLLDNLDLDPKIERKIRVELNKVTSNPSKAIWAVSNANAEDLTGVNNKVKRISQRLVDKGVLFADVLPDKVILFSKIKSANNGKKIGKKVLSAIPGLGTLLTSVIAVQRVEAANMEDELFINAMSEMGINDPFFPHHSVAREAALISSEEVGGAGGFAAGASAAAIPSAACNAAYLVCVGIGGLIGSFVGDEIGNAGGGFVFDKATQLSPEQREQIKQKVRDFRRNANQRTMAEDPEKPGGQ
jgi:RHS repeat-associated protein